MNEPVPGISAFPDDDNARYFHVLVTGPADVRNITHWLELFIVKIKSFFFE